MTTVDERVAANPFSIDFSVSRRNVGDWSDGPGFNSRDTGLFEASHGALDAQHLRRSARRDGVRTLSWRPTGLGVDFMYVFQGSLSVNLGDGELRELGAGDCVRHAPNCRCRFSELSVDSELFTIRSVPAGAERPVSPFISAGAEGSQRLNGEGASDCAVLLTGPEVYVGGAGPRPFFEYRDLGVGSATDGKLFIHHLRPTGAEIPEGGTNWHMHTMAQWYLVTQGEGNIRVKEHGEHRMFRGDSMTIDALMPHDEFLFSGDYSVLQLCTPAEYETIDVGDSL